MNNPNDKIPARSKEWQPFLLCIVTAGIFWFFNALNHDYTADLKYPVKIVYDKEKLIPVEGIPTSVDLNATGYGWNFLRESMQFNQKPVYIKPIGLPKKNYITANEIFALFAHQLNDVKINYFIKDTLQLHFDYLASKSVILSLDTQGLQLANGYHITGPITVQPSQAVFSGPVKSINQLKDTLWLRLPSETFKGGVDETVGLEDVASPLKPNIQDATIQFDTKFLDRQAVRFKVYKRNFPLSYKLLQDSIEAVIFTDPDAKNDMSLDSLRIVADFKNRSGNKVELTLINFARYTFSHHVQRYVGVKKTTRKDGK